MPLKGGCATSDIGFLSPFFIKEGERRTRPTLLPPSIAARRTKQQARHLSHFGHCQEDASQEGTAEGGEVEYITVYAELQLEDVILYVQVQSRMCLYLKL